ncbi:MAG: DoxX family protein [Acidobacteriota bacterium]|nr:DoxX family protein [Acidobacteriota bacterium]
MEKVLGRFSDKLYSLLRIFAGFMFLQHGAQKLFGALGGNQAELFSLMGLAGVIEFFGGLAIMLGIFTSWAAFLASGTMATGYFMAHAPEGFWTVNNHGETAVLYCFGFLYMAAKGDGAWSLGGLLRK